MMHRPRLHAYALSGVLVFAACSSGVQDIGGPGGPDTTGTSQPPGTVQRASITLRVGFDAEDAGIAQTAGITVSGLTVRLQRSASTEAPKLATTDAAGVVKFDGLLQGLYTASVDRVLTATELARLPEADREASVFAGGAQVVLSPPASQSRDIAIVAARRGSLLVSELFNYRNKFPSYPYSDYVEVYNNADTTIYLDGIVLFRTTGFMHTDSWGDCPEYLRYRGDGDHLWANSLLIFPGSGREFPIQPGEGRVVATDALNHASASGISVLPDLSRAQFETVGTEADIDNPLAANMIRGYNASTGPTGRGTTFPGRVAYGVALPAAAITFIPDTLVQAVPNGSPFFPGRAALAGIRREHVLDVFSNELAPNRVAFLRSINNYNEPCDPWLASVYERRPAELFDDDIPQAVRRKSLGLSAAGREILQRTRTGARDLELGTPLRRSLNR